jgi:NTE family protein
VLRAHNVIMIDNDSSRTGRSRRALVLTGGGARAAYQVGVLKALAEWVEPAAPLPFRIVCGTSAGAIIGSILAANAAHFPAGVSTLERFWSHFQVRQVWRNDPLAVVGAAMQWVLAFLTGGWLARPPHSLFDNHPLRLTLESHVNFARILQALDRGDLDALAVTAAPYQGAPSRTYYMSHGDSAAAAGWSGGEPVDLTLDHLMASAAVPFLFPAVRLTDGYYGDGAMRQREPLAPAINLGADRVLVIGVRCAGPAVATRPTDRPMEPSFGQIFGFMLDTLFSSSLRADIERLERDNRLIEAAGSAAAGLRPVRVVLIEPSVDPGDIAARHERRMPFAVRLLMRTLGAANRGGHLLLSYLLFDGAYARDLIDLGYADAMAHRGELQSFLSSEE